MRIHTIGTCAGTEPMPTRQHTCCMFEINNKYYTFDAGAGCSRTAWLNGIPLPELEHVFISHPHRDHIGGLPALLWDIRKIVYRENLQHSGKITIHIPDLKVRSLINAVKKVEWCDRIKIKTHLFSDGVIFKDENVVVEARHTLHMGIPADGKYSAYSFRISAEDKKIVYSGDVRSYTDMGDWLDDCDLLLMETGHHNASNVCAGIRADGLGVKDIMFVHSGREILNDYQGAKQRAEEAWGKSVIIAEDGLTYPF